MRQTLMEDPANAAAWLELGRALAEQRRFTEAKAAFQKAANADGHNADVHFAFAEFLDEVGDARSSMRETNRAIRLNRRHVEANALKGKLLRDAGRNDEAMEHLKFAWNANPRSTRAGLELADWDLRRNAVADATDKLALCVSREPDNPELRRRYANVLELAGRNAEALRELQWLARRGEAGADGMYRLAELYSRQGLQDQAWDAFAEAKRVAPRHPLFRTVGQELTRTDHSRVNLQDYPELATSRR